MPRKKIVGVCSENGCGRPIDSLGLCRKHYMRQYQFGRLHKVNTNKRSHPLYILWHDRKMGKALAPEWLDFWVFVRDVGDKPGPNYFLVRLRGGEPYGPTNFRWQEHLKRKPGESKKDWWARKWAARQVSNPGIERGRSLVRRYGITVEQYNEMRDAQGGVCAICKKEETAVDPKTGSLRRLAVDHCHKSKKIRALLCFRCNAAVGKLEESPSLCRALLGYLEQKCNGD